MKLYNTLTRKTEEFKPINPKRVKVYTCGPTVYSYAHIGNFTCYIYWDLLVRTLRANGYNVDRVLNITDVGEKYLKKIILEERRQTRGKDGLGNCRNVHGGLFEEFPRVEYG